MSVHPDHTGCSRDGAAINLDRHSASPASVTSGRCYVAPAGRVPDRTRSHRLPGEKLTLRRARAAAGRRPPGGHHRLQPQREAIAGPANMERCEWRGWAGIRESSKTGSDMVQRCGRFYIFLLLKFELNLFLVSLISHAKKVRGSYGGGGLVPLLRAEMGFPWPGLWLHDVPGNHKPCPRRGQAARQEE